MHYVDPDREIVARKEHKCFLCGLRLRKRAKHWVRKVFDGEGPPLIMRMHAVCRDASSDWDQLGWEVFMDDFSNFRRYDLGLPLICGQRE